MGTLSGKSNVRGYTQIVSTEFTRAANVTAYTANQVVAPAAGGVSTLQDAARSEGGSGYITGIRLSTDKKSITPRFRIHLFNASNATLAADATSYKELYADASKRIGYYDLPAMATAADTTNSDMSRALDLNVPRIPFICASGSRNLFFALECLDGFTPASGEKFTMSLNIEQN